MPEDSSSQHVMLPDWLPQLTSRFCSAFVDHPDAASIGCHHFFDEELQAWEHTCLWKASGTDEESGSDR